MSKTITLYIRWRIKSSIENVHVSLTRPFRKHNRWFWWMIIWNEYHLSLLTFNALKLYIFLWENIQFCISDGAVIKANQIIGHCIRGFHDYNIQGVPKKVHHEIKINKTLSHNLFSNIIIAGVSPISSPSNTLYSITIDHLIAAIWSI